MKPHPWFVIALAAKQHAQSICKRHRREPKKDLTSRIPATTLHDLERIEDEDENKSRLRVNRI